LTISGGWKPEKSHMNIWPARGWKLIGKWRLRDPVRAAVAPPRTSRFVRQIGKQMVYPNGIRRLHARVSLSSGGWRELSANRRRTADIEEASMSETVERAHETIEEHAHHTDPWARNVAILISVLAAALAITEIGGNAAQNAYLAQHVELSNNWAFFQSKNVRAVVLESQADVLASLPNAQDPAIQARIQDSKTHAIRMRDDPKGGDGMKQLAAIAHDLEAERADSFHRYHKYEFSTGALQIAIVLASVSLVTRMRALTFGAAAIGAAAITAAIGVATNMF
jgi:hypothetical protein